MEMMVRRETLSEAKTVPSSTLDEKRSFGSFLKMKIESINSYVRVFWSAKTPQRTIIINYLEFRRDLSSRRIDVCIAMIILVRTFHT